MHSWVIKTDPILSPEKYEVEFILKQKVPISIVNSFLESVLVEHVDFLIFGIIFGLNTLIGSAIIILTSLYILRREARVKKGKEPNLEEI